MSLKNIKLVQGDCLEVLKTLDANSVDLIACDLPYGITNNKWDEVISLEKLWPEYERVLAKNGVVVLTSKQPFTSMLIVSSNQYCKELKFRYDIIWQKTIGSGQLNIKNQPLRTHEDILIFTKGNSTYNPQFSIGKPYKINRKMSKYKEGNYNKQKIHTSENNGFRHPKSVITISNPRIKGGHPTQKPLELMDYLIKTYSNEGDIVLDNCMGSGTTGVSCVNNNRNFIGIEKDEKYFAISLKRIKELEEIEKSKDKK